MRTIFHITARSDWEAAQTLGRYEADSLKSEGFIHLSRPHQVLSVADFLFKDKKDLVLLQVGEELVTSPVKYEGKENNLFPHIYGPLNLNAILNVYDFSEGSEGFHLPKDFYSVENTLIRKGVPGDEAELASCHVHTWQQSFRGLVSDSLLDSRPLSFRSRMVRWKSVVEQKTPATVFVAESASHGIVGFCSVEAGRDERFKGKGEITAIYCLNEYKGKGVGARLFLAGCRFLKERSFQTMYLWTIKDNPTISFYKKMGGVLLEHEDTLDLGSPVPLVAFEWSL